jgi:hypothetical protein
MARPADAELDAASASERLRARGPVRSADTSGSTLPSANYDYRQAAALIGLVDAPARGVDGDGGITKVPVPLRA